MPPATVLVLGDLVTDVVAILRDPLAHRADTRASMSVHPGGSGATQAAWLAATGRHHVHFLSRHAPDPFTAANLADLARWGVITHGTVEPDASTGLVISLVEPDGERSMLTDRGVNLLLRPEHLPPHLFQAGGHFHLSGYLLLYPETRPAALHALRLARQAGMTLSLDPVAAPLVERAGPGAVLAWTRGAHLCIANLDEARALLGQPALEAEPAARALLDAYAEVVVKLGPRGALWVGRDRPTVHAPADPVPAVVDTTGAGDAFCGGFLAAWLDGAPPAEALRLGNRFGARAVARVGARPLAILHGEPV